MRRFILLLVDVVLVMAATFVALLLRDNFEISGEKLELLLPYFAATLLAAVAVVSALGLNRGIWRLSAMGDYLRVVAAAIAVALSAVALGFAANRLEGVARALPILQAMVIVIALVGARVLARLRELRRHAGTLVALDAGETVLVVGLNSITELFLRSVAEFAAERLKVAGILGRTERHTGRMVQQHKVLGTPEQVAGVLRELEIHGVFVERIVVTMTFDSLSREAQEALLTIERTSDIRLDFFSERIGLGARSDRTEMPVRPLSVEGDASFSNATNLLNPSVDQPYLIAKRAFDLIVAVCAIVVLAPLATIVALLVAIDVGLPTVFWQQRPGRGRVPFKLYKFRTMANAHDRNGNRLAENERLSALGSFLRRSRLDELPQLYNILVGEMSFVGPRPLLPVDQLGGHHARLLGRPGLTGWAQVNGGRDISPIDKIALDLWYLKNASLWLDLKILALTIRTLVGGERLNEDAIRQAWTDLGIAEPTIVEPAARPGSYAIQSALLMPLQSSTRSDTDQLARATEFHGQKVASAVP